MLMQDPNRDLQPGTLPPPPPPPTGAPTAGLGSVRTAPLSSPAPMPSALPPPPPPPSGPAPAPAAPGLPPGATPGSRIGANGAPVSPQADEYQRRTDTTKSPEQYQTWINMGLGVFDANGKLTGFKSELGYPGTFDNPTDCPPGMQKLGERCVGAGEAAGLGAGGAGGGVPGGGGGGDNNASDILWGKLMDLQSRYSPNVMAQLISDAKSRTAAQGANEAEAAKQDMISRGVGRSLNQGAILEGVRRRAGTDLNSAVTKYTMDKINGDQQDRIAQLQGMQSWLNSYRQHVQAMTMNDTQKRIALANLDLAQRNLNQQLQMQQNQFDFNMAAGARGSVGY